MKTFLNQFAQDPKECLINSIKEQKFAPAYISYALGVISLYFAIKLNSLEQASFVAFIIAFIFWFLFNIIFNFILAALSNLFLEFAGYTKSNAAGIFIVLGLSQLILTLLIPWFLIKQAFEQTAEFTIPTVIIIFLLQIYFILSLMKKVFELPKVVSFLSFVFSFIAPFMAVIIFIIFSISFISTLIG